MRRDGFFTGYLLNKKGSRVVAGLEIWRVNVCVGSLWPIRLPLSGFMEQSMVGTTAMPTSVAALALSLHVRAQAIEA